jgi:hypothetical protein|tara:strand:- start:575 stop:1489 length:915 start_codon:yes stop_codon:yes gene_type:complete
MLHFSAISDKNYLVFGLTLYESLCKHCTEPFTLHYLALDNEVGEAFCNLPNVTVYDLETIEKQPLFDVLKKNNPEPTNVDYKGQAPFHWALASFFTYYLLDCVNLPECLYCDTDIFFYRNPGEIFRSVDDYSIGLVTHKHIDKNDEISVGYFNVGVIYFRNDQDGMACLKFWKRVVADKDTPFFAAYGQCGDQAYLHIFEYLVGEESIKVLDLDIGHGAPWNFAHCQIIDGNITWNGQFVTGEEVVTQPLVFNHFSHFRLKCPSERYQIDFDGEWGNILPNPGITEAYDDYFEACMTTKEKYEL